MPVASRQSGSQLAQQKTAQTIGRPRNGHRMRAASPSFARAMLHLASILRPAAGHRGFPGRPVCDSRPDAAQGGWRRATSVRLCPFAKSMTLTAAVPVFPARSIKKNARDGGPSRAKAPGDGGRLTLDANDQTEPAIIDVVEAGPDLFAEIRLVQGIQDVRRIEGNVEMLVDAVTDRCVQLVEGLDVDR